MTRGDRFREARGKMSQAKLAKIVGCSQPTIAAAEAGGGTEYIVEIALATGYSAYWLATGKGPKKLGVGESLRLSEDEERAVRAFITTLRTR